MSRQTFYGIRCRVVKGSMSVRLSTRLQCSTHITIQKTQCKVNLQQEDLNFYTIILISRQLLAQRTS